jgi:hypothetical protein
MTDNTIPPDNATQDAEQVEQAVEQIAAVGVFALIILCYACVVALVLGGLAFVVLRLVAP